MADLYIQNDHNFKKIKIEALNDVPQKNTRFSIYVLSNCNYFYYFNKGGTYRIKELQIVVSKFVTCTLAGKYTTNSGRHFLFVNNLIVYLSKVITEGVHVQK